jgi:hypothetical protein
LLVLGSGIGVGKSRVKRKTAFPVVLIGPTVKTWVVPRGVTNTELVPLAAGSNVHNCTRTRTLLKFWAPITNIPTVRLVAWGVAPASLVALNACPM